MAMVMSGRWLHFMGLLFNNGYVMTSEMCFDNHSRTAHVNSLQYPTMNGLESVDDTNGSRLYYKEIKDHT